MLLNIINIGYIFAHTYLIFFFYNWHIYMNIPFSTYPIWE